MKTVELFCGTKSFSKVAKALGHEIFTVDSVSSFKPDCCINLLNPLPNNLVNKLLEADIVWMSPPCQTFSMAARNTHWTIDRKPKTKAAIDGYELLMLCKDIAEMCIKNNKIYFIENPRARARWFLPDDDTRHTVWYCQYGDSRAKPTDIWTNLKGWSGQQCRKSNPDCHHERAPRGSMSGVQNQKNKTIRGQIPQALFEEIFKQIK